MYFISVSLTLYKSPGLWHKFDLDYISGKGDQWFKSIGRFRYLGLADLPQEFLIEKSSVNAKFLENSTGDIPPGAYLLSITEIMNSVQLIGTGALLIANIYILCLIRGY